MNNKKILYLVFLLGIIVFIGIGYFFDWKGAVNYLVKNFGYFGFFIAAIITSAALFVGPTYLLPPIGIKLGLNPIVLSIVIGIGSALGESTGYFTGLFGSKIINQKNIKEQIKKYRPWFKKYGGPVLFIFALTPLPMDVAGIIAGMEKISYLEFLFWVSLGKILRFLFITLGVVELFKIF